MELFRNYYCLILGSGTSAVYIGSLLLIMSGVQAAGLPDKDQTRGMVTSLWVCCDCLGGYIGALVGSAVFVQVGFEFSSLVMTATVLLVVIIIIVSTFCSKLCK